MLLVNPVLGWLVIITAIFFNKWHSNLLMKKHKKGLTPQTQITFFLSFFFYSSLILTIIIYTCADHATLYIQQPPPCIPSYNSLWKAILACLSVWQTLQKYTYCYFGILFIIITLSFFFFSFLIFLGVRQLSTLLTTLFLCISSSEGLDSPGWSHHPQFQTRGHD